MAQPPPSATPASSVSPALDALLRDKASPRGTVRIPGKALVFGEYGLLAGGPGIVLTLPEHAFLVELDFVPCAALDGDAPVFRFESAFLPGGAVTLFAGERAGAPGDAVAVAPEKRFAFGAVFPYLEELVACAAREDGAIPCVRVRGAFPPEWGLGSSSAIIAAVHVLSRRVLGLPPAFDGTTMAQMDEGALRAARESVRLVQGSGSCYDVVVQTFAADTLEPRLLWVVPSTGDGGASVEDLGSRPFDVWSRETGEGGHARGRDLRIVPSGSYAPTRDILSALASGPSEPTTSGSSPGAAPRSGTARAGEAHSALAYAWREAGFSLAALGGLFERSRVVAREQGLFGAESGPFASTCAGLEERGIPFKTMGAGHGDSLLAWHDAATLDAVFLHLPLFSLARHLARRLPPALVPLQEMLWRARTSGELQVRAGDRGHATAPSNIALVKYWGKETGRLQVPVNSSVSYTIGSFRTFTRVEALCALAPASTAPSFVRAGMRPGHVVRFARAGAEAGADVGRSQDVDTAPDSKIAAFLARVLDPIAPDLAVRIDTLNTFPTACGIASSASGFAALAAALADLLDVRRHAGAAGEAVWIAEWARVGSGSATRSCFDGASARYVAWERVGEGSRTRPVPAGPALSALGHGVVVFDAARKEISSSEGHGGVRSSPLHAIRAAGIPREMARTDEALETDDFGTLAAIAERDAFAMHAVMQGATPPARYFGEATSAFVAAFVVWRDARRIEAFWTLDAGPNVHLLFAPSAAEAVRDFVASHARERAERGEPGPREWLENASHAGLRVGREALEALRADPASHPRRVELAGGAGTGPSSERGLPLTKEHAGG